MTRASEAALFPPIEPFETGVLDVGEGHRLAWERSGAPDGYPLIVLHGGPGSGRSASARRYADPARFQTILFDQRGCGLSTPHASEEGVDLSTITTASLVADIEALRRHLGIERWMMLGGSWGATLALAYAGSHRERLSALALYAVATTTRAEIDWITRGVRRFLPDAHARFCADAGLPPESGSAALLDAYHARLMDPDLAVRDAASRAWCDWEIALAAIDPSVAPHPRYQDPRFRLGFARLVTHVWRHGGWLKEGALLEAAAGLGATPGALIHGRLDISSPPETAHALARVWPGATLELLELSGHDAREPGMAARVAGAVKRLGGKIPRNQTLSG